MHTPHTHTHAHTQTHTHKVEYYLAIKNEWNFVICDNMDGPKWQVRERQTQYILSYMWNLKKTPTNPRKQTNKKTKKKTKQKIYKQ